MNTTEIKQGQLVEITTDKYAGYVGEVVEIKGRGWVSVKIDDHGVVNVRISQIDEAPADDEAPEADEISNGSKNLSSQIRKYRDGYESSISAGGSISKNCGDEIASILSGKSLEQVWDYAMQNIPDVDWSAKQAKYYKLNAGHQRMILGNMIRARHNATFNEE